MTVIEAEINGMQVKIVGVIDKLSNLPAKYLGDVADCFIIEDINELRAWNGDNWQVTKIIKAW